MRKLGLLLLSALLFLTGCGQGAAVIRNSDDGKLRIDEQHEIDFYLGNDEVGAEPITEQCLAIIGDREPDSVKTDLGGFNDPRDYLEIYHVNGAEIILLYYETTQGQRTVLQTIDLEANHVLASGIRIGSTEEALKRAYADRPEYYFRYHDAEDDDDIRYYVLYGDWFERYLILFEVNTATGRVESISYDLDV